MATQAAGISTLTSEQLEKLQAEIKQEFIQILNNGKFIAILEKYGIYNPAILNFQSEIDLSKIEIIDAEPSAKIQSILPVNTAQTTTRTTPTWYNPCPHEDYPNGCWL